MSLYTKFFKGAFPQQKTKLKTKCQQGSYIKQCRKTVFTWGKWCQKVKQFFQDTKTKAKTGTEAKASRLQNQWISQHNSQDQCIEYCTLLSYRSFFPCPLPRSKETAAEKGCGTEIQSPWGSEAGPPPAHNSEESLHGSRPPFTLWCRKYEC